MLHDRPTYLGSHSIRIRYMVKGGVCNFSKTLYKTESGPSTKTNL